MNNHSRNTTSFLQSTVLNHVNLIRVHRFAPDDLQFDDALITSSIVIFKNEPPVSETVLFSQGGNLQSPNTQKRIGRDVLADSSKWSPLFHEEDIATETQTFGDYFSVKRGLVTGDNHFFILDEQTIEKYDIPPDCLKPILPSPRHISSNIITKTSQGLPELPHRRFLFQCNKHEQEIKQNFPKMWRYIEQAKERGVHEGYICSRRTPWYSCEKREPAPIVIPYMGRESSPLGPFRFILNLSDAVASNVYLLLYPKPDFVQKLQDRQTLRHVWEILNRIPLGVLVRGGRVYGGGLHKLEPNELASIPIPAMERICGMKQKSSFKQEMLF